MSVRRWKEALGKEGLRNQITRVGEIGQESSVYCIFHLLPAPPSLWLKRGGGGGTGGLGGGVPLSHTHTKNRNNGERDLSRNRI